MLVLTRRIVDKAIINDKPGMVAHEIGILKEMNHENIVSFYDTFESKHKYVLSYAFDQLMKRHYISLELAFGGTLTDWIGIPFFNFNMMKEADVIHCVQYVPPCEVSNK